MAGRCCLSLADVIYRSELDQYRDGAEVIYTLTRRQPPGWTGFSPVGRTRRCWPGSPGQRPGVR
jgi:hypothetical protein